MFRCFCQSLGKRLYQSLLWTRCTGASLSFRLRVRKPTRLSPVSMKVAMSLWQHTKISSLMMSKLGKGNCAFPAGLQGWALPRWMNPSLELMKLRWRGSGVGTTLTQAPLPAREDFFQFCYEPMSQSSELSNTCMNNQKDKLWSNVSKS